MNLRTVLYAENAVILSVIEVLGVCQGPDTLLYMPFIGTAPFNFHVNPME